MKLDDKWISSFQKKLDEHYSWPSLYMFKFIVPTGKEGEVKRLFPMHDTREKLSQKGNYTSVTIQMMMPSSEAVVEVYVKASEIEGIVAL
jgi:uncharacterized protein